MTPIPTKDKSGNVNGWLLPLWNATENPDLRPDQVYLTVVDVGCSKGPHLHKKRRGCFHCIAGRAEIITGITEGYMRFELSPTLGPVIVPPGFPCEIRNIGTEPAYVINMPSPAWTAEDPDDWPVEDWNPPCTPSTTTA